MLSAFRRIARLFQPIGIPSVSSFKNPPTTGISLRFQTVFCSLAIGKLSIYDVMKELCANISVIEKLPLRCRFPLSCGFGWVVEPQSNVWSNAGFQAISQSIFSNSPFVWLLDALTEPTSGVLASPSLSAARTPS